MNNIYQRQLDIVKPEELNFPITVIGAGGIGSWTVLALAKMGCYNITVVDPDTIEEHNTASQLYSTNHIGMPKVIALAHQVSALTGKDLLHVHQKTFQDYYLESEDMPKVLISAVDSLNARREIWEMIKPVIDTMDMYIDARMTAEMLRLLIVTPHDENSIEAYDRKINGKTKAHKESCTARAIAYNTLMCAGFIAHAVKKYAKKEGLARDFIFDISNSATIYRGGVE